MRNPRLSLTAAVLALSLMPSLGHAASAADPPATATGARDVMENVLRDVMAILRDPKLTVADRGQKVRQIAYDRMDFQTISRLTMARHWRAISQAQQTEFTKEFRQHMSATYGEAIDHYTDEDIKVIGDRQEADGDWTVQTRILGKGDGGKAKEMAKVDYRLRQIDAQWKVIDVTIDGVSMVANFRAQFQDIMSNGGIDRLLKLLREKNAAADK